MQRQVFHRAAALRADNVRAPAELGEAVSQLGTEGVRRVAPQVMLVAVGNGFLVDEGFDRVLFWIVRVTQQEARQGQADVARVFRLAETLPFGELRTFEVILQIFEVRQAGEAFQAEELRTGRGDKWRVGHARNTGHVLHQLHIRGAGRHEVVGDDRADRLATELTVFSGVDVLVQAGLHYFRRIFEIVQQVLLGDVEDLDLDVFAKVGALHQQLQTTPGRLQGLEVFVVKNFVHLAAELGIDLGDHAINHGLLDRLTVILRLEQLFDKGRYTAFGDVIGFIVRRQAGFGDDAVENAVLAVVVAFLLCCTGTHGVGFLD
ncbi:hypothetical protein D3C77_452030 [compost metagenome]